MGVFRTFRLWRLLGKVVNHPIAPDLVNRISDAVGRAAAKSARRVGEDKMPWAGFAKRLSESKIALVTTAGVLLDGQEPFDVDSDRGDPSYREIRSDFDKGDLRIAHTHYSHARFEKDPNVIVPIDRLRELADKGVLAGLAPRFYSFGFGGGLTREFIDPPDGTAHRLSAELLRDEADFVLLVPA